MHRQFAGLVRSASGSVPVELRFYRIHHEVGGAPGEGPFQAGSSPGSSVVGSPSRRGAARNVSALYRPLDRIFDDPPDALVVTGAEPRAVALRAEPGWEVLERLLRWASSSVPSTLLSCLAAHAALELDGAARSSLPAKRCGVFAQRVDRAHPLAAGLPPTVAFPHSRWNDVPAERVRACGYRVVMESDRAGWSVAARERRGRVVVLLQGHPEYEPTTLLREFRRDLRRFHEGSSDRRPDLPTGYLDPAGVALLGRLRSVPPGWRSPAGVPAFPLEDAAAHVGARWAHAATRLFSNWIVDARRRASTGAGASLHRPVAAAG